MNFGDLELHGRYWLHGDTVTVIEKLAPQPGIRDRFVTVRASDGRNLTVRARTIKPLDGRPDRLNAMQAAVEHYNRRLPDGCQVTMPLRGQEWFQMQLTADAAAALLGKPLVKRDRPSDDEGCRERTLRISRVSHRIRWTIAVPVLTNSTWRLKITEPNIAAVLTVHANDIEDVLNLMCPTDANAALTDLAALIAA